MAPAAFKTLIEMLSFRAGQTPGKAAFSFEARDWTFEEIWEGANRIAANLQDLGVTDGDRVVIAIANGPEFFFAFYGAQRAGAIAVPVFPGFGPDRLMVYAGLCGAKAIVVPTGMPQELLARLRQIGHSNHVLVTDVAEAPATGRGHAFHEIEPNDIAFIQYTSGSTGDPKGVQISHHNLLTNIRQMIDGMDIGEHDVFVSWLPVYHDMGLILKTMVPFYLGLDLHLLATDLRDTSIWLKSIRKNRGTFTAAPDFAYRLCLRQIRNPGAHDLSSLRVALNAAEPVRYRTIADFEKAFRLKNVVTPAYGLAEATVGVCMWPPNKPCKVDDHGHVSVGRPFRGVEMTIVDNGEKVATGTIGEIAISSPALPSGYFNNRKANEALFWKPGHILSGDLGYVDDDGDYFIVGRKKNTINQSGRTIYTQEIEEIADTVPLVRYAVALGIDRQRTEGEQIYLFAEIREDETLSTGDYEEIIRTIVGKMFADLGIRPARVYLVRPKTIPLTYNGKFQHGRLKSQYLDGTLVKSGQILYPEY